MELVLDLLEIEPNATLDRLTKNGSKNIEVDERKNRSAKRVLNVLVYCVCELFVCDEIDARFMKVSNKLNIVDDAECEFENILLQLEKHEYRNSSMLVQSVLTKAIP